MWAMERRCSVDAARSGFVGRLLIGLGILVVLCLLADASATAQTTEATVPPLANSDTIASPDGSTNTGEPTFQAAASGYNIRNTDCNIGAGKPHETTRNGKRVELAKGGIRCATPKERIWVKAELQRRRASSLNWSTVAEQVRNKSTGQPNHNVRDPRRVCRSGSYYIYRLVVVGTVVNRNGKKFSDLHAKSYSSGAFCG